MHVPGHAFLLYTADFDFAPCMKEPSVVSPTYDIREEVTKLLALTKRFADETKLFVATSSQDRSTKAKASPTLVSSEPLIQTIGGRSGGSGSGSGGEGTGNKVYKEPKLQSQSFERQALSTRDAGSRIDAKTSILPVGERLKDGTSRGALERKKSRFDVTPAGPGVTAAVDEPYDPHSPAIQRAPSTLFNYGQSKLMNERERQKIPLTAQQADHRVPIYAHALSTEYSLPHTHPAQLHDYRTVSDAYNPYDPMITAKPEFPAPQSGRTSQSRGNVLPYQSRSWLSSVPVPPKSLPRVLPLTDPGNLRDASPSHYHRRSLSPPLRYLQPYPPRIRSPSSMDFGGSGPIRIAEPRRVSAPHSREPFQSRSYTQPYDPVYEDPKYEVSRQQNRDLYPKPYWQ